MRITDYAIEHRTTVFVMIFLIFILGMIAYLSMPREATPDIKIPVIMVGIPYPGSSPTDVESLISTPVETEMDDLDDVDELSSVSSEGISMVYVTFMPDVDLADATQRVRDRVNRARAKLPKDIQEPMVKGISSSDWPVIMINISGPSELTQLKAIAEDIADQIEAIDGVLEVDIAGGLEREIRVEVNPHLLNANGLSLTDVTTALAMENINIPGGPIEEGALRYTLRVSEEITDPDEIGNMVVKTNFGHPIRIREIAQVVDGYKERSTASRFNGTQGVSLTVKKKPGANIIYVVDSAKKLVDEALNTFPAGTKVAYLNDYSKHIRDMVRELENNIITALLLVMAVLFLFIGGRNALFVALAIPMSMLVSFMVLSYMGITLNMVVLFSLVLALGMLVDNAIVIVENIYRHRSMGKPVLQAAREGTSEVGWPVITSTLTTLSVFFPLLSWPGIMGKFMGYLPLTLIVTLTSSLFVALIITPVIAGTFMTPSKAGESETPETKEPGRFLRGYRWFLRWSINHSIIMTIFLILMFVGSIAVYVSTNPKVEFFPETTPEQASVEIESPEGTNIDETDRLTGKVEEVLARTDNLENYLSAIGVGGGWKTSNASGTPNMSKVSIDFPDSHDRVENPLVTMERLRGEFNKIAGANIRLKKQKMGPPAGAPVNIEIAGNDYEILAQISEDVKTKIKDIKGLTDLQDDYSTGKPELGLKIDPLLSNKLILNGLQIVAGTIRTAIYGTVATTYRLGDEEFDVTVRLQDRFRDNREDVLQLVVAGKEGRKIPLSQVARLEGAQGAAEVRHLNRKRVITVSAEVEGRSGAEVLKDAKALLKDFKPAGASISYTGENKEMEKASSFLSQALITGVFLIAMVLLTQFNSFSQVMIILFSVFLSMIGVIWGLIINRMPFSIMMTGLGVISLAGVVVNNGIVLIDFINKLRAQGYEVKDAVVEAGMVRLRPVLLTAGTTMLGLIPMAQGFDLDFRDFTVETGTGSMEFWGPMAISVIYGLFFATILTLVMVPVMYLKLENMKAALSSFLAAHTRVRKLAYTFGLIMVSLVAWGLIQKISAMITAV